MRTRPALLLVVVVAVGSWTTTLGHRPHRSTVAASSLFLGASDDDDDEEEEEATLTLIRCSNPKLHRAVARWVWMDALVDTGSPVCELREGIVRELMLPLVGVETFETANGTITEKSYRLLVGCEGASAEVEVVAIPDERFEDGAQDDEVVDEAVLGHEALAALGLLVDCKARRVFRRGGPPPGGWSAVLRASDGGGGPRGASLQLPGFAGSSGRLRAR